METRYIYRTINRYRKNNKYSSYFKKHITPKLTMEANTEKMQKKLVDRFFATRPKNEIQET